MTTNDYYDRLMNSEPMGFINPLTDLGEFDPVQMIFKKPVRELVNKYSGRPYNLNWQNKIEAMRVLYIQYQKSLQEEDKKESLQSRIRNEVDKAHVDKIVTTYLKLGFRFKEIEPRVSLSYKTLRRRWHRSDYVTTRFPEFYNKKLLATGDCQANSRLPKSLNNT